MEELMTLLSSIWPMSPDLENYLLSTLVAYELRRNEYLLKKGQVCNGIYFVHSGLLRVYYEDNNQVQTTKWLLRKGDVATSVSSFFTRTPTLEPIHAIKPSLVYGITYDELYYAFGKYLEFNFHGRELILKYHLQNENRVSLLQRLRDSELYLYMKENEPELVRDVPDKYLASYLGMDPATFSRIKGQHK